MFSITLWVLTSLGWLAVSFSYPLLWSESSVPIHCVNFSPLAVTSLLSNKEASKVSYSLN